MLYCININKTCSYKTERKVKTEMLAEILKEYIKEKGIKQSFIAEKIEMSPQILGQLLNGQRKIEVSEYFRICNAIEMDPIECAERAGIYKVNQVTA